MSNGASSEKGETPPARDELEPDPLEFINTAMTLAARDLRIAASVDPKLLPLLERADQLDLARRKAREHLGEKALSATE